MANTAQTNLQLLNQLRDAGWSPADLEKVSEAYALAMRLFSARFRPSGKPFVAHLVGTASILARLGVTAEVVTAGLLHAAYLQGDFGTGSIGMTEGKRREIRARVGGHTEALIAGYTILVWDRSTLPAILAELEQERPGAGPETLSSQVHMILLIRLANDLEDLVDLAALYCSDAERRREESLTTIKWRTAIANRLGFPALAAELEAAVEEIGTTELELSLGRKHPTRSFVVAPASHVPRLGLRLQQLLASLTW